MSMPALAKIQQLKEQMPKEYQSISHFVEHALESIDTLVEEHRKYVAAQALYGDKIVGSEERLYRETVLDVRAQLLATLEKTVEDILHKGDKHWDKHFKDGVE